jgi:hypothetical protein
MSTSIFSQGLCFQMGKIFTVDLEYGSFHFCVHGIVETLSFVHKCMMAQNAGNANKRKY